MLLLNCILFSETCYDTVLDVIFTCMQLCAILGLKTFAIVVAMPTAIIT